MEESTRTDNYTNASTADTSYGTTTPPASTFNQAPVRRLYRTEGPISGVSGGLADYFGVDPSAVRLAMVIGAMFTFPVIPLAYVAAWMIIPEANPAPTQPIMAPSPAPAPPAPTGNPVPPVPTPDQTGAVDDIVNV